ncbi:MAG: peptide deformylase [Saprospiraceae bacterium]|jgi:peptide deformylase|nr:peptide deformylase [Candidatus Parvibacillus calidus]MBX2937019.1 peptide deformylase [Saprospiraceae bacterium]HNS79635.1 peptide deformylase [Syntrophorhabdus sp.]MBX7180432.1 peptide deformylase [Saprospiraceae bacterium]MCB0591629.1 peptide deformylase [Saprospiraceae bacterium]
MILPIYAYGQPVLKREGDEVSREYPELDKLIDDMFETMYNASGVGLAAPQVGLSLKLFVVDTIQVEKEETRGKGIKKVFLNAELLEETGDEWAYEEGCLSIPDVRGEVDRLPVIRLRYQDEKFEVHEETFEGINARVIQHEYDHTIGKLFIEKLGPVKKQLIKRKLENIKRGKVSADYRLKFAKF